MTYLPEAPLGASPDAIRASCALLTAYCGGDAALVRSLIDENGAEALLIGILPGAWALLNMLAEEMAISPRAALVTWCMSGDHLAASIEAST